MRLELVERELPSGPSYFTFVNLATRVYVGQLSKKDAYFNGNRIVEAVNLYQDLHDAGLLPKVLAALERYKAEQPK